jgi:hypothetical protein
MRVRFSITLPPTLPRNGLTRNGRLTYWLVGTIDGLPEGATTPKAGPRSDGPASNELSLASSSSSSSRVPATSALPSYSNSGSGSRDVEWLRGSVRSERRIAVSHNPNPDGGVSRMDDDFTHNLPDFGTCRIQVRVNEVRRRRLAELMTTVVCGLLFPTTLHMHSSVPTGDTVCYSRETRCDHHHNTSADRQVDDHQRDIHRHRERYDTSAFVFPSSIRLSCSLAWDASRWYGSRGSCHRSVREAACMRAHATFHASWDVHAQVSRFRPARTSLTASRIGVPIRASHKLVYEVYFSVFGKTGSGSQMPTPGPGGLQVMRRNLDVTLPQVSDILLSKSR